MHPKVLLDLAAELLREVLRFEFPADSVVSRFFRLHKQLGQRERHALAETVYAVLRQKLLWQHLARSGSGAVERRLALLAWQGDPAMLRKALSVGETQWLDEILAVDRSALPEALRHNLPAWLALALQQQLGEEFWPLVESLAHGAALDLRVNALKTDRPAAMQALLAAGVRAEPTPYSPWGLRVEGKPAINHAEPFSAGWVEVQDEGSQLLALLTEAKRGEMVADFCAGAGGKTLALGAMMRNTGRLYAFDISGHRLDALKPRLARSGLSNVYPIQIAHERDERIKRLTGKLARVLVDAPCSGLGTLRRNPDLKWRQSPQGVAELQLKQQAILSSAARLLQPGGRLVYATCSVLPDENEAITQAFADSHRDFIELPAQDILARCGVAQADTLVQGNALRLWPHRHATDGFYAMVWERR